MSIGADLAAARQRAGMNIAQVSQLTRIRESIIQAIERDDFSACGADFYARGHIRAIARAIGVDAEPLVLEYDSRLGPSQASAVGRVSGPERAAAGVAGRSAATQPRPRWNRGWAVVLVIALAAAVGVITYRVVASPPAGHAAAAAHTSGTARHAARKHPAPASPAAHRSVRHLVISVAARSEPCWAELTTRSGVTIFEGIIGAGTSRTWTVRRAVALRLGNPGAIRLSVDGKHRTRLGSDPVTLHLSP
jgi:hypothetical protein